jgi:hypothetical protein
MAKTLVESKEAGPAVIRFTAKLVRLSGAAKSGTGAVVDVPKAVGAKLGAMVRVEGIINGHPFRAPLDPTASGGHAIRANQAMLRGAKAGPGDTVELAILGPEPEPTPPADLRDAFKASPEAKALWTELTTELRRDWVRWIEATANADTRARRVQRTIEQLAEGKRRPCCVNMYEYMLLRVRA